MSPGSGNGPEVAVFRMLGLFDRPADEKAIASFAEAAGYPGTYRSTHWTERQAMAEHSRQAKESKTSCW